VRIGWIGTPLNKHHLESIRPAVEALVRERDFVFVVIGLNGPINWDVPQRRFVRWRLEFETDLFSSFDIGIMPLLDSPFAQGKCAFKLIQYMAAGLPVVASPTGVNREVVQPGINGYLAETSDEWIHALRQLIDDSDLRRKLGENGRRLVQQNFSLEASWMRYGEILRGSIPEAETCA
jgi:glycosyltransferase involved in cell wall biosynthesis